MNFKGKKLIIVTGKGGVGKSLTAAAVALGEARQGRRTCLVELGSQSYYEPFFETRGISYEPIEVIPDVHIALYNSADCLREYVLHYLRVPKLYDILFQNRVMKAFFNAAPALPELAILGKLTSNIRGVIENEYDVFVVDCYSTGHALALLRAPGGLSQAFKGGPLYDQAAHIAEVLASPEHVSYVVVTLPEEMPVTETGELYKVLRDEFNAEIDLVCNKLYRPPVAFAARQALRTGAENPGMTEFIDFLDYKEKIQGEQLKKLTELNSKIFQVPYILRATSGQDCVVEFAKYLEEPGVVPN